jgi:hypothetical protein
MLVVTDMSLPLPLAHAESVILNRGGTDTRQVVGEVKTRWMGTFPRCRVIGDNTSLR